MASTYPTISQVQSASSAVANKHGEGEGEGEGDEYEYIYNDHESSTTNYLVGLMKDIALWNYRSSRMMSLGVVAVSTVLWFLLEVYEFNVIPLASYAAMSLLTLLFLQGNIQRLLPRPEELEEADQEEEEKVAKSREDAMKYTNKKKKKKKPPKATSWQVTEDEARQAAVTAITAVEQSIQWAFNVSTRTRTHEWPMFAKLVSALLLLGYIGRFFDLITMLYIGLMVGMTVPVTYLKNQDRIRFWGQRVADQSKRWCAIVNDKVVRKLYNLKDYGQRKQQKKTN